MVVQTKILASFSLDLLEDEINRFLQDIEASKFIDLVLSYDKPLHIAVVTYKKGKNG